MTLYARLFGLSRGGDPHLNLAPRTGEEECEKAVFPAEPGEGS